MNATPGFEAFLTTVRLWLNLARDAEVLELSALVREEQDRRRIPQDHHASGGPTCALRDHGGPDA